MDKMILNSAIRNPHSAFRKGFTTGTCAQAAAKAAVLMLVTQKKIKEVAVKTASGVELQLKVIDQEIKSNSAKCGIVKDSGDDPDVTNGIKIYAEVKFTNKKGISIIGGYGVGKVTKPGLPVAVGEYAINPVPKQMITNEIKKIMRNEEKKLRNAECGMRNEEKKLRNAECGMRNDEKQMRNADCGMRNDEKQMRNADCGMRNDGENDFKFHNPQSAFRIRNEMGVEVIVSVPQGKEIAKKTFNPKLGIMDGISIIGTTGIVVPRSIDAYKKTLSMQLNVIKEMRNAECGMRNNGENDFKFRNPQSAFRIHLVLGYVGEKFCQENGLEPIIKIGDHVGFMLEECAKKGIKGIVLIGHIGKLIKIANGQFNTNIQYGDNRISSIADYAANFGAPKKIVDNILIQTNAEATIDILKEAGLISVFDRVAEDVVAKTTKLTKNKIFISCIILSLKGEIIGIQNEMNKLRNAECGMRNEEENDFKFRNPQSAIRNCFTFFIIGIGPGSMEYLLPVAKNEIEKADILIGAKRLLPQFKNFKKEEMQFDGKLNEIIPYIKNNTNKKRIAVLVSGDTGLFSLLEKLSKEFNKDEYKVIPGISSMQIAFAKIGESWQDAKIISLHGKEIKNLKSEIKISKKVFLFTDQKNTPKKIAEYLLKNGIKNRRVFVFENLTYEDERIVDTDLKKIVQNEKKRLRDVECGMRNDEKTNCKELEREALCVMIILKR
ncbi:precorrin-6y C5,15-methyltransferase (decarboxylating) subunit CbiE [Candidatus Poribacteria bacterium]|nr:precorrin-6y C5,15-methyltransferase (decarboxylating) subunit CbiE [Candidatus Poribacteria bacterium]